MKKLFISATMLLFACFAYAQTPVEVQFPGDELAKEINALAIQHNTDGAKASSTTWVDNRAKDNWFFSIYGGIGGNFTGNLAYISEPWKVFDSECDCFWNPSFGVAVGKWYSPVFGARLAVDYTKYKEFTDGPKMSGAANELINGNLNLLVNLKNMFMAYNPDGFFNPVLYAGPGLAYRMANDDLPHAWTPTVDAGLQLNFRLGKAVDLFLDFNALLVPMGFNSARQDVGTVISSDLIGTVNLGLTYKFPFRSFMKADFSDPAVIEGLNNRINDLRDENEMLRNRPIPVCPECPEQQVVVVEEAPAYMPTPVFFSIGSAKVTANQHYAIAEAAKFLKENPSYKLDVTGYADKKTGTSAVNQRLSDQRAKAVADIMVSKYGVDKSRLIINGAGDKVQPFAENDWNRVVIFVTEK
jgi:hypothetical protein